jgi:FKBP-type peptidyl-prolyl cis-trans isomerase SlyD
MKRTGIAVVFASLALACTLAFPRVGIAQDPKPPAGSPIEKGSTVRIEYTVTDESGELVGTNKGEQALQFTHGQEGMVPGLEQDLLGMRAGEEKKIMVKPEQGFGPVDPSAQTEVPKDLVPAESREVGARLLARDRSGESRPVRVKEVKEQTVVLDLNHPLAGKTLFFDVKVLGVEPPGPTGPAPTPGDKR